MDVSNASTNVNFQFFPKSLIAQTTLTPIRRTNPNQTPGFKSRFLPKHQKSEQDRESVSPDRSISSARPGNPASPTNGYKIRPTLAQLPEEGPLDTGRFRNGDSQDRLSREIKSFLSRTSAQPQESWRLRSSSLARETGPEIEVTPMRNSTWRSSSVAPSSIPGTSFRFQRELSPLYNGRDARYDFQTVPGADFSYRDTVSVTRSVASRASNFTSKATTSKKFMTLEEECNWILSGREPLPPEVAFENGLDSDEEDNTLDDISGDEFDDVDNLPVDKSDIPKGGNSVAKIKLSEMTADIGEDNSGATMATDLQDPGDRVKSNHERVKLPRPPPSIQVTESNGTTDISHLKVVKQQNKSSKEAEMSIKKFQQQQEQEIEKLVSNKKLLERKLEESLKEVEDQKQTIKQLKQKAEHIHGELQDSQQQVDQQSSRINLLEKQNKKLDMELGLIQEDRQKDQVFILRMEKDIESLKSLRNQYEDQLQKLKQELTFKDEKIGSLIKDIDELQAESVSEQEVAILKKQKLDLETRLREEEQGAEELSGQVQLLEQARLKLETTITSMKKDHNRELGIKDEELEDARACAQKKVKALEQQLENEHEDRLHFVREKHELENRIIQLQQIVSKAPEEEQLTKLKKDLKRTKALLKDAQTMMDRSNSESSNKVLIRQLKNQLEDAEFSRTAALKSKQNLETELADVQGQLEDVLRIKSEMKEQVLRLTRERADLTTQLEDHEEELQEVLKKYKANVAQMSNDQITIQDQSSRISELEDERNKLREMNTELLGKIGSLEVSPVASNQQNRLEFKIKDLESKLELEQTTRTRLETQINRLKESIDKVSSDCEGLRIKELASQEAARKLQLQLRQLREEQSSTLQKELEAAAKCTELENQLELAEAEIITVKNELKVAQTRIEDLQSAINGDLDSDSSSSESDSSAEGMEAFLEHHRRACSVQLGRESMAREADARASIQREIRASIARESVARVLETMPEEPELKMLNGSLEVEIHPQIRESAEEESLESHDEFI